MDARGIKPRISEAHQWSPKLARHRTCEHMDTHTNTTITAPAHCKFNWKYRIMRKCKCHYQNSGRRKCHMRWKEVSRFNFRFRTHTHTRTHDVHHSRWALRGVVGGWDSMRSLRRSIPVIYVSVRFPIFFSSSVNSCATDMTPFYEAIATAPRWIPIYPGSNFNTHLVRSGFRHIVTERRGFPLIP